MGDINVANTQTDQNGRYAFSVPVGANYFPAAFSNGATVYTVVEPQNSSFVNTLSPATSVPVNLAPLYTIIALITAAVVIVCYLFVRRFREKGAAVVGAARPSRRAAAPVVASGKTAEASPPRAFVRRLHEKGSAISSAVGSAVVRAARLSRRAAEGMNVLSIDVARKELLQNLRDRRGLVLLVALPILLMALFAFTFGGGQLTSGGTLPYEVAVINNDAGVRLAVNNTTQYVNYGTNFTGVLENATLENSTTHLFHLNNVSEEKADDLLQSRGIDALIIIPSNFSAAFVTMVNNSTRTAISSSVGQQAIANPSNASLGAGATVPGAGVTLPIAGNTTTALVVEGDGSFAGFLGSQLLVTQVLDQYRDSVQQNASAHAAPNGASIFENYVTVDTLPMAGTGSETLFDSIVPGLIVFTLLLQMSIVASSLVRDIETGMLDRLKLSKIRAVDQLSGTFLAWTLITVGQILLLLGVAVAFGYHYQGGFDALGLAVLIGLFAGMASISMALVIASFAKNDVQAMFLGAMIATPLGFMAGAFLPLPQQVLAVFAGQTYITWDVLPWTWAINALRSVVTYGSGLSADVVFDIAWLISLTAILFVIGVAIYSRTRLRTES
jgi:ABC-2 type transport system permease protein